MGNTVIGLLLPKNTANKISKVFCTRCLKQVISSVPTPTLLPLATMDKGYKGIHRV